MFSFKTPHLLVNGYSFTSAGLLVGCQLELCPAVNTCCWAHTQALWAMPPKKILSYYICNQWKRGPVNVTMQWIRVFTVTLGKANINILLMQLVKVWGHTADQILPWSQFKNLSSGGMADIKINAETLQQSAFNAFLFQLISSPYYTKPHIERYLMANVTCKGSG